ncbi:MAG: DUF1499 domain-containing protein [Candidatus Binatia bacterium]
MAGAAGWAFRLGTAGLVAFVVGPLLAHFRIVRAVIGFLVFDVGGFLGIAALVAGIVSMVRGRGAGLGLALGAVVTVAFLAIAFPAGKFPPINDITTDTATVPKFVVAGSLDENRGRDMRYAGAALAQRQRQGYPDLRPLPLALPPDEAFKRVVAAAQQVPDWVITRTDAARHALEGVATSRVFRFKDDFVVEVRPHDGGSVVHMRSKSRDGKGDIGANATRIKTFFAALR